MNLSQMPETARTAIHLSKPEMESPKLKFGIDRLLSNTTDSSTRDQCKSERPHFIANMIETNVTKPLPTLTVPCSDCVSSIFRCCKLSPNRQLEGMENLNSQAQDHLPGYMGSHNFRNTTGSYSMQPIRPFATRPNMRIPVPPTSSSPPGMSSNTHNKRKRSWSRAVFSNLQRKGLERRFQLQKYITKPDRRQLAATLGLTDAQVKVWFQNRRMKWRHTKESGKLGEIPADSTQDDFHIDVDTVSDDVD
ncbi:unnamed protein product [Brassicogethes aeneus]|uniref:Homeobox domain-containing protein n=1 Tax=Brassicogethes aeneus TaxID=1431903 RepID=A0A9P0BEI6_BRAAE|nr:unnamed protein product [Brassicogethes aeneus]